MVVVDDAHVRTNEVATPFHAGHETDARFAIHANCWPTRTDDVRRRPPGLAPMIHAPLAPAASP